MVDNWQLTIPSCIVERAVSVDVRREKSYKLFYGKPIKHLNKLWTNFHVVLQ